ncbi:MAG: hypothetical protein RBT33_00190 [Candidatus Dojkabacteria bacterium]|jgi:hypothetical protein|nr:hypothetical protein [Candidatus Dojkabacteria bacterium]
MEKDKKEKKEKQLDFGLKNPPQNIYYKYKDQYELWLSKLETRKFTQDILTWFVLIISTSLIFTQIYSIETVESLPTRIPVFNYFFTLSMRLVDSNWIYVYPAIGVLLLLVGTYYANRYYHREKELSKVLLITILLANLSLSVIFMKLLYTF